MRNLHLSKVSVKNKFFDSDESFVSCFGHNDDSANSEIYVCSSNLIVFNYREKDEENNWSTDLSELTPVRSKPVNITYISLSNSIYIALANGELIMISDSGTNCDLVGVCESGLLATEWSPDQEILVLVTTDFKVIVMSCTFDPLHETKLLGDDVGEMQFITVGWGKKETQFHGSEGKKAATAKPNESTDSSILLDHKVMVSWRGDGNLFAVGYNVDGVRRFKVFDRDGNLQSISEKVAGLEGNLSWRPSGNLIATTQKFADRYLVSFFEKNGLKHGEFTLPIYPTAIVEDILWSYDSEILIILSKEIEINSQKVFLYTRNNYHWYLKQCLNFGPEQIINNILCGNDFDAINEKTIYVMMQNGNCYTYTWSWNVDHSHGKSSNDDAVVAVIDGRKCLLTGFRHTIVPPPMCNVELLFDDNINSIQFISDCSSNTDTNSFLVSFGNKIAFVSQIEKNPLKYTIEKVLLFHEVIFPFQYYNWHWLCKDILLCVYVNESNIYSLNQYKVENDKLIRFGGVSLPSAVTSIQSHPKDVMSAFLQIDDGNILQYKCGGTILPLDISIPVVYLKFRVVCIGSDTTVIGLSHKGCLYIDNRKILSNVNTFFVHTQYLLITTLKHLLICVELTRAGVTDLECYEKNESASQCYKRKIERGSRLVITVPNGTRTVFQMPRGNLETIQPRPLSLKIIGQYLDDLKYQEAFDLMRKERINLNLIYDHNPTLFVSKVDVFLKSINNNAWLNLFLADLENVDVTKTMYSSCYADKQNDNIETNCPKIQYVCDLIRTRINESTTSSERILPLLTTYVKSNTGSDLEQALLLTKKLKEQETNGIKIPVSSDEALKYLLYLVNVDNLFDVALGMYDFDLVLLVANKSQKDPKEYIPMLNDLNEMDDDYKRFNINKHLKRFDKAVECLAKCGEARYSDLRTFVKYHSLYKEALALFSPDDEIFKEISDDYGLYLKLKKRYLEAGLVYEKAKSYDKAIYSYKDALQWELVFKLVKHISDKEAEATLSELVTLLKKEKRYAEALDVMQESGANVMDTIKYAIKVGKYKTAMKLCVLHDKGDLMDSHLLPKLLEECERTNTLISEAMSEFEKYRNRLFVVRENKVKRNNENLDTYGTRDMDLYSDAGSTVASSTGSSGRSFRSSKNRRKHERKVASLKEGSQYEDTALVMALYTKVTSTFELRGPVKEILIGLCSFNKEAEAAKLQFNLETVLKEMKDSFKKIWTNELAIEAANAAIAAENAPEGVSIVPQGMASLAPHMRIAPVVTEINWKLEDIF